MGLSLLDSGPGGELDGVGEEGFGFPPGFGRCNECDFAGEHFGYLLMFVDVSFGNVMGVMFGAGVAD